MTRLLLVHQNMPGQYRELMGTLAADGRHEVAFLTQRRDGPTAPGVRRVVYEPHHRAAPGAYALARPWEDAAGAGLGAMRAAEGLRAEGFRPDVILGHGGWGELLFLRDVWPGVPILALFEYHYGVDGGPVGFDPEEPAPPDAAVLMRARNAVPAATLAVVDRGYAPTRWQRDTFPPLYHPHLYVAHEGIRTDRLRPDPGASIDLGRAGRVTRADEVVTYVARNLERVRGFHLLMRALPSILEARPRARVVVVGGNETSYGRAPAGEGGLRAEMEREVGARVDWSRVHMVGRVPYGAFRRLVQVSRCHVYLTMPFVLSWSLLEAMAMGAVVVASDVAPVREAIDHGVEGMLVPWGDPEALADRVVAALADPAGHEGLGRAARARVRRRYDFATVALPAHLREIDALLPPGRRIGRLDVARAGAGA